MLVTMVSRVPLEPSSTRQDGFGTRLIEELPPAGPVERLVLAPTLATPGSEQAIRARAAHLTSLGPGPVGRVFRVERKAGALSVLSLVPDGVTLSDILAALEFGTLTLSNDEVLELAASVVRAAAGMHELLGTLAHGALAPAHVVLKRDGSAMFTGAVFGDAIQALQRNREHIWREFGLALPAAASVPRFDQHGDVTQLGALVLAIGQRRSLRRDEFPRGVGDLVMTTSIAPTAHTSARLRMWLQDALQLHGRVVFSSGVDALRAFNRFLPNGCGEGAGALALRTAILQVCGESEPRPVADAVGEAAEHRPRTAAPSNVWSSQTWNHVAGGAPAGGQRHVATRS
jgi:hypothetical protein